MQGCAENRQPGGTSRGCTQAPLCSQQPAFPLPAPASRGWSTLTLSLPQGWAAGAATAWYLWSKRSYLDQMIVIKSFCRNWRMKWLRSEENTLLLISVRCYYRSLYSSKAKVSMKCSRQTGTAYANQNKASLVSFGHASKIEKKIFAFLGYQDRQTNYSRCPSHPHIQTSKCT